MDARIDPQQVLGFDIGDAHVIRNAGGRASDDAIRSLVISSLLLGTDQYLVIHHTECGMASHTNEEVYHKVQEVTGADASTIDFLMFSNLEDSVREDVQRIRASPYIPDNITVHGFIYDVRSGRLSPVADR
jgi:carbonic anhydrase